MSPSPDTLAAVRRSNQVYYEQITEQTTLSCGVAFTCPQYPGLFEGNHLREVILPPDGSWASAWDEVQAFYAGRNLTCYRWVAAADTPTGPIEAFLAQRRFKTQPRTVMAWQRAVQIPANPEVRILPARAMRKAFREIMMARYEEPHRRMLAEAANDRMDDPQFDQFIAMVQGKPAGCGAFHEVGDIGRLRNIYVSEPFRRQGVGRALMGHLLALSRRLALRITVLERAEHDIAAERLVLGCGFESAGSYVEFIAPQAEASPC